MSLLDVLAPTVRRARVKLVYESADISGDIAPMLLNFSFTDNAHGQADDLEITLENRKGLWGGAWRPKEGDVVRAFILCTDWYTAGDRIEMPCGVFSVDEISLSGPPDTVVIRGVSSFVTTSIRGETKTQAWENTNLGAIAAEIAWRHELELFWEADNVDFERVDQREESDLAFLQRLCEENGCNLKAAEGLLIIFQGDRFPGQPDPVVIERGVSPIAGYEISTKAHDIFRACQVSYQDPKKKTTNVFYFEPDGAPEVGPVLKINERVESEAEAEKRAMAALREKNKGQTSGSLELVGAPVIAGGSLIELKGFYSFDGQYFVEQARHSIDKSSGYKTSVTFRNTLEY